MGISFNYPNPPLNKSAWHFRLCLLLLAGIVIVILCVLTLASVPPVSRDALTHHLTIPKMYLAHGGIYEIPSIQFSYFPMNLDLLYLSALYFKNDIAAKYLHFIFALLTAGLIYRYLKQVLNKVYGLIGALFFLTIPVIIKLSVTVYVDLGLVFFSWASLYLLIKWYDTDFSLRFLIPAGIACGLALGTKYNGLILLPIMGGIIPILYSSKKNRLVPKKEIRLRYKHSFSGLGWATVFILIALVFFSPWMVRNIIWKYNPVYPLYNNVFNRPATPVPIEVGKEKSLPKNAFWMRRHVYGESFVQTLSIPIRAFFQGKDDVPKYFDGKLNPFLLLLPLMAFVRFRRLPFEAFKVHRTVFVIFTTLFMLFVFFKADFRIRYMAPAIPPLVVLSIFGIRNMADRISLLSGHKKKLGLAVFTAVILSAFAYNANYIHELFHHIRPLDYLSGAVDRDAYISRFRIEHPVICYANNTLPMDARVLCLSIGDRTYYVDRKVHLAEDFYKKTADQYLEKDLLRKLMRYGTTHVIINKGTFFNWLRTLPEAEQTVFLNVFKKHTRVLYEKNNVLLLALEVQN
ncbi:MAG: phospholipid carrier-dependent glycosyltransferase [Desulfobacterales bacterium]|nr:phospholipid carrier-dependent glycosyltransferase [Desulfobacterales bacterium]